MKKSMITYISYYLRSIRATYSVILIIIFISFTSCVNLKKANNFYNVPETEFKLNNEDLEPVIKKNDLLSISVTSLNPEATEVFNASNVPVAQSSTSNRTTSEASGYLVDQEGFIRFPILGKIKAAEKSKQELREEITQELVNRKLLLEPIVDIRYLNFRVSVLGEVKNPTVVTIPSEKVTLLEALGLAGDLTVYANRDNILLIREEDNIRKLVRLDLTSDEIFTSPYYNLKSNDIIYVEANKSKVASTSRANQWLPIILSSLSLAVIALDRFF
ncbi:polysaccharide biosynthesis/export family protein [Antarcticibacterium sp. 1MA-6-2]|uniref:polysaccharide biosynthesis/export family protein n=1 Tax=Antarcticibacterium sp. 1MA-6-2 TaxID=2908210 RepID=UPI001F46CF50|nr:polysaccharide biosynthesis/export family protein [Antarcticibacterium sp. 1MA-6-2]UJH91753.1 polysaccharide biosynthesis/export family protein [Antarcticibacterium sp. 1MA-6-2]